MRFNAVRYWDILLQKGLVEGPFEAATAYADHGEYESAASLYAQLLAICPDDMSIRNNYAFVLEKMGRSAEAAVQYRRLFEVHPEYGKAALGFSRMLEADQCYGAAVDVMRKAVHAAPGDPGVMAGLANALVMAGNAEAALLWYALSLDVSSHDRLTISNFLYTLQMVSEIPPEVFATELDLVSVDPALSLRLSMSARQLRNLDGAAVAAFHCWFGKELQGDAVEHFPKQSAPRNERTKIGYFSADLYAHPVGYFLEGVLGHHDLHRFEIYVFCPYEKRDQLTAKLKEASEHWVLLDNPDRYNAVRQIREYKLDIAVDMAGHTAGNYLDLFASRIAGVQITWGGYPGTTGLPAMDYIIADKVALPPGDESCFTERPIRLPNGYVSFMPPPFMSVPGPLPAETSGVITFGSFNTVQKLTTETLALWSRVLIAIPEARLFLKTKGFDDPSVCASVLHKFDDNGISSDRVILEGYSPRGDLLKAYQRVDIALDPVPYQGGVTVLEALWMGVPTLVRRGRRQTFIRHAESHLVNTGLQDWIAVNEDDFVSKAVSWSRNLGALAELRRRLRQQLIVSPICDAVGFTRDLEAAFEQAWRELHSRSQAANNS